jgi:hypothetical protein
MYQILQNSSIYSIFINIFKNTLNKLILFNLQIENIEQLYAIINMFISYIALCFT